MLCYACNLKYVADVFDHIGLPDFLLGLINYGSKFNKTSPVSISWIIIFIG